MKHIIADEEKENLENFFHIFFFNQNSTQRNTIFSNVKQFKRELDDKHKRQIRLPTKNSSGNNSICSSSIHNIFFYISDSKPCYLAIKILLVSAKIDQITNHKRKFRIKLLSLRFITFILHSYFFIFSYELFLNNSKVTEFIFINLYNAKFSYSISCIIRKKLEQIRNSYPIFLF